MTVLEGKKGILDVAVFGGGLAREGGRRRGPWRFRKFEARSSGRTFKYRRLELDSRPHGRRVCQPDRKEERKAA
jgi:hypothetical protein